MATVADPLGQGNTALLGPSGLNLTPLGFWDVRQNLTASGGTVSSLADVKGDGTYGPALVQATQANQPAWDGTTINFNGGVSAQTLVSASVVTGADVSLPLTAAIVIDVSETTVGRVAATIQAAAGAAPFWRIPFVTTGPVYGSIGDKSGTIASTAATGTGKILLVMMTVNVHAGTAVHEIEVPTLAKVNGSSSTGSEAAGNQFVCLGNATGSANGAASRFRALLIWSGGYTTGQRDTLKTWAQTFHGAVLL